VSKTTKLRRRASVDDAVEVAQGLAEMPIDPERALQVIEAICARHRGRLSGA